MSAQPGLHDDVAEVRLAGVVLSDCAPATATRLVRTAVADRRSLAVHLCNAYTLTLAGRDPDYAEVLGRTSLNLIDGTPVAWYASLAHRRPRRGPVRGPTLMRDLLDSQGLRHFLLGGTPGVLDHLQRAIARQHPEAVVVGGIAPPFAPLTDDDLQHYVAEITAARADIVWVGLGTPKQDVVAPAVAEAAGVVAIAVGAAFDFLSGHKTEAPRFLHRTGLEWLFRLAVEPRRLWRRYLIDNLSFIRLATRELRATRRQVRRLSKSGDAG